LDNIFSGNLKDKISISIDHSPPDKQKRRLDPLSAYADKPGIIGVKEALTQPHVVPPKRLSRSAINDSSTSSTSTRRSLKKQDPFSWQAGTIPSSVKELVGYTHCDRDKLKKNIDQPGMTFSRSLQS